jgi:hypothetical protein
MDTPGSQEVTLRFELATPWNAVVAQTREIAAAYRDAFNLSSEMWDVRALGENPAGSNYERLVIVNPRVVVNGPLMHHQFQVWASSVHPHGTVKII